MVPVDPDQPGTEPDAVPAQAEPHEDPAVIAAEREARASKRLRQTARDMVLSLLVVLGAVLVLWLPFRHPGAADVKTVDPAPVIAGARQAETWPVLAPVGLGADWRCTSARIDQAADGLDVVHLGYLSPTSTYVGLEQSATRARSWLFEATVKGREQGTVDVSGTADGATYVVVGTGPIAQLEEFAGKLRAG